MVEIDLFLLVAQRWKFVVPSKVPEVAPASDMEEMEAIPDVPCWWKCVVHGEIWHGSFQLIDSLER